MFIYKITNILNNRSYVGRTIHSVKRRFDYHCSDKSGCLKLKRAIQKYGKENFKVEIIEVCNSLDILKEREIYWIKKLNTIDNGYNIILGDGFFGKKTKSEHTFKKTAIWIKNKQTLEEFKFDSHKECALFLKCSPTRLFEGLKKPHKTYKNWLLSSNGIFDYNGEKYNRQIPIIGFDLKNLKMLVYTSLSASVIDGFNPDHISKACRGKNNHTYRNILWFNLTDALPFMKKDKQFDIHPNEGDKEYIWKITQLLHKMKHRNKFNQRQNLNNN